MTDSVRIIFLVDATGSMGSYCSSVGSTLQQLFAVLDVLFEGKAQVDIVSYEDYCDGERVLQACISDKHSREQLKDTAAKLKAGGGGDAPEAVKTALNHIIEMLRAANVSNLGASCRTVVVHYTDAPPHHNSKLVGSSAQNLRKEIQAMKGKDPGFDWMRICQAFRQLDTPVITILARGELHSVAAKFMLLLGHVIVLPDTQPDTITRHTMGMFLQWMGQPAASISRAFFKCPMDLAALATEDSPAFVQQLKSETGAEEYSFEALPAFDRDLRLLMQRFQESEAFQDVVFRALQELFVSEHVLAITYNSVLGLLWRLVCKHREDPRVQPLCDALSSCCSALPGAAQAQLRVWIDESYNQLEEVREIISAVADPLAEGALVLDAGAQGELPTKEEMRSILHAPTPGVLRKVQALLTRLIVVRSGVLPVRTTGGEDAPMYLPLALKGKSLFSLLSHLLLPGMMMSLRPAAMIAILAYLSGNTTLRSRAQAFLASIRGSWIPPVEKAEEYPEILNGEFVRLVVRVPEFLTDDELALYRHLALILRVRRAGKLRVQLKVGFTPTLHELTPDTKLECQSCGLRRSMTLMKDGTCGLCLSHAGCRDVCPEPTEDKSHMVECRSCKVLYAVVNVANLRVAPKCHYCRTKQPCESVACTECKNRFCAPTASFRFEGFVCAVCSKEPQRGTTERSAEFAELAELNPGLLRSVGLPDAARAPVFSQLGLFKLWMNHKDNLAAVEPARLEALAFAGKPVMNVSEAFNAIVEKVLRGKLAETCNLCCEERPLGLLQSACGLCTNLACQECLRQWYGRLAPGRLYVPSEGLCAFCKRTPRAQTLRAFNRPACRLAGRRVLQLRADMYYGWCGSCFRVAEAVPRDCAAEPPNLRGFECEACKATRLLRSKVSIAALSKACPACRAPTVKISGCNHMTCLCDAHWCWQCGSAFDPSKIYEHMDLEHGTIGLDEANSDFSDDEA